MQGLERIRHFHAEAYGADAVGRIAMGVSFVLVGALQMLRRPSLSSWGVLFCPVRWCRDPSAQIGKCIVTIFIFM